MNIYTEFQTVAPTGGSIVGDMTQMIGFALQGQEPEFDPHNTLDIPGVMAHAYDPNAREAEKGHS